MSEIDINVVSARLGLLNEVSNQAIQEIVKTGRLRVSVGDAFVRGPEHLLRLIAHICVLKQYAQSAAPALGVTLGPDEWNSFFAVFTDSMHVLPSGKLS